MFNYIKTIFEGFEGSEGSRVMLGWIVLLMRMTELLLWFVRGCVVEILSTEVVGVLCGQDTQHPHQLCTKDFYHASILTNNNTISFILISSKIHPSITSLPSLPSKPSNMVFI
jgi:hypothetical protein